jgi:hypothetical protein
MLNNAACSLGLTKDKDGGLVLSWLSCEEESFVRLRMLEELDML